VIREHYKAVKTLLPPTVNAYLFEAGYNDETGEVEKPLYPHVILWGDLGRESSGDDSGEALCDEPTSLWIRLRATYAATNGDSLMIVARNVRYALNRKVPAVEGRSCSKLRQDVLMDAQVDLGVTFTDGSHPVYAVDEFAFVSDPA